MSGVLTVGLEGHCEQDIHCEDPSAVCSSLTCLCKEGYYKKGHICRKFSKMVLVLFISVPQLKPSVG